MIDLETRAELESLLNTFTYALDRADYATIKQLYHPGAMDDHGAYNGDVDGLVEWLKGVQASIESSAHTLTNMRFARAGDFAESESRGITYLRIKGNPPQNMMVIGRHFDKYERRAGVWRFSHRALCVDWAHMFAPGGANPDMVNAAAAGRMGPDDPFYSQLRLLPQAVKGR